MALIYMGCIGCPPSQNPCPGCVTPTLQWDSISASQSKCGHDTLIVTSPPKKYLTWTMTGSASWSFDDGCARAGSYEFEWIIEYIDCSATPTYSGTASETRECPGVDPGECSGSFTGAIGGSGSMPYSNGWVTDLCGSALSVPCLTGPTCGLSVTSLTTIKRERSCSDADSTGEDLIELTNEFTTLALQDGVHDDIGSDPEDFDDDWDDTAGVYRNLTSNELTYSARRAKFRYRHAQPQSGYLKIWARERVTTDLGVSYRDEFAPYVWTSSTPGAGFIESEGYIMVHPSEEVANVTIDIDFKWSCDPDYEPDWDLETRVNGYAP